MSYQLIFQCRFGFKEIDLEYKAENTVIAMFMASISNAVIQIDFPNTSDNWNVKWYHSHIKTISNAKV